MTSPLTKLSITWSWPKLISIDYCWSMEWRPWVLMSRLGWSTQIRCTSTLYILLTTSKNSTHITYAVQRCVKLCSRFGIFDFLNLFVCKRIKIWIHFMIFNRGRELDVSALRWSPKKWKPLSWLWVKICIQQTFQRRIICVRFAQLSPNILNE